MRRRFAMTAVAGNAVGLKHLRLKRVQCIRNRQRSTGMAEQTFRRNRTGKVRLPIVLISRSHIPGAALRVIRNRRLKDVIVHFDQITEGVVPGTDDKRDPLFI